VPGSCSVRHWDWNSVQHFCLAHHSGLRLVGHYRSERSLECCSVLRCHLDCHSAPNLDPEIHLEMSLEMSWESCSNLARRSDWSLVHRFRLERHSGLRLVGHYRSEQSWGSCSVLRCHSDCHSAPTWDPEIHLGHHLEMSLESCSNLARRSDRSLVQHFRLERRSGLRLVGYCRSELSLECCSVLLCNSD
jgi:hypothetical protein